MQTLNGKIVSVELGAINASSDLTNLTLVEVNMAKQSLPNSVSIDNLTFTPFSKHPRFRNLTAQCFGRLQVLGYKGHSEWWCYCRCGTLISVVADRLCLGKTQSCGCLRSDIMRDKKLTHGKSFTSEYRIWAGIQTRCYNTHTKSYKHYGGRGIKVCDRWLASFENFLADMGKRPDRSYSIERKNNNGDYAPNNCYWADRVTQMNNKRSNRLITYKNKTQTLAQWCRELHLETKLVSRRLRSKWSVERTFEEPKNYTVAQVERALNV